VALAYRVRGGEAPARGLVLQVLGRERIAGVVDREHVIGGASADAAVGAVAGDGHVTVAGQVADELEPARLAGASTICCTSPMGANDIGGAAASAGWTRTRGSATRGTPWNRARSLSRGRFI